MRRTLLAIAAAILAISSANARQTVKIGLIMAYSGQFADVATQMDNAIAGKKIELIRKPLARLGSRPYCV